MVVDWQVFAQVLVVVGSLSPRRRAPPVTSASWSGVKSPTMVLLKRNTLFFFIVRSYFGVNSDVRQILTSKNSSP